MNAACEALFRHPPTTLSQLEAQLGTLGRDVASEDRYLIRREQPFDGVKLLYVSLIGRDLRSDPDPAIAEVRLLTTEDLLDVARAARGAATRGGGEGVYDPYHGVDHQSSRYSEWRDARGAWKIHDESPHDAFWALRDPPFEAARSPADEADLIARIVAFVTQPFGFDAFEAAFGPIGIDGRWPEYFARGPTWKITGQKIDALDTITLELAVPLAAEPLVAAFGWGDVYISSSDVHMTSWKIRHAPSRDIPTNHGARIEIGVVTRQGLTARPEITGYGTAYALTGARVNSIRLVRY